MKLERRTTLVAAIARGRRWLDELITDSATDAEAIAARERLATRYDKTAESYLGFVNLAAIRLWIRHFVNTT